MAVSYSREDFLHDVGCLFFVHVAALDDLVKEFAPSAEFGYDVAIFEVLVVIVNFEYIWMIQR